MAAGLPVIVSNRCGCAAELVREGNGILFDPATPAELNAALQTMASLPDRERARKGIASAERIQQYSPERFGAEVAQIVDATQGAVPATAVVGGAQ